MPQRRNIPNIELQNKTLRVTGARCVDAELLKGLLHKIIAEAGPESARARRNLSIKDLLCFGLPYDVRFNDDMWWCQPSSK